MNINQRGVVCRARTCRLVGGLVLRWITHCYQKLRRRFERAARGTQTEASSAAPMGNKSSDSRRRRDSRDAKRRGKPVTQTKHKLDADYKVLIAWNVSYCRMFRAHNGEWGQGRAEGGEICKGELILAVLSETALPLASWPFVCR